jgi:hypothetical protein
VPAALSYFLAVVSMLLENAIISFTKVLHKLPHKGDLDQAEIPYPTVNRLIVENMLLPLLCFCAIFLLCSFSLSQPQKVHPFMDRLFHVPIEAHYCFPGRSLPCVNAVCAIFLLELLG